MARRLDFNLRAARPPNYSVRHERWDAVRGWVLLAAYQSVEGLPWHQLDEKAYQHPEWELRLTGKGGKVVAEWAGGERMPELKGALAGG